MWLSNTTYLSETLRFMDADIHIDDRGVIDAIAPVGASGSTHDEVTDCSDCLVIPGLVNAHFHSQSTMLRGLQREMTFTGRDEPAIQAGLQARVFDFLDTHASTEEFKTACMKDYIELIHQGVTFCADSGLGERSPSLYADAMSQVGLRGIIDAYEHFEEAERRLTYDRLEFAAHLPEEEDISEEALVAAQTLKRKYDPIFMTHSLETASRRDKVMTEWQKSSIELFDDRDLLSENVVLFQAVHLTETDIEIVRRHGASVVHCPVSNLPDIAPVEEFLANGINVAIGTDWARTDIWEAMRLAYGLIRRPEDDRYVRAEVALDMATINGAKAYLMDKKIGRIALEFEADLTFVEKDALALLPMLDRNGFSTRGHNLVMEGRSTLVRHVMVAGNWIMRDQRILTVNEAQVNARYREIMGRIFPAEDSVLNEA